MEDINMNNQNEDSVVSDFYSGNEEELNEVNEGNQENNQINLENIIYNQTIYNFDFVYNYFLTILFLKPNLIVQYVTRK